MTVESFCRYYDIGTSKYVHIFGCNISYEEERGTTLIIYKFLQVLGILNNILKSDLAQRQS
jgi:hypothetical protein